MTAPLSLTSLGYVILFVRDVEKTAAFYRDALGVPVKMASPEWTELGTEGTTLALHRHDRDVPRGEAQAEVVFNVEDVRAAHAALRKRDVRVDDLKQVWEGGPVVGVSAKFTDPDGNRLSIHGTVPKAEWPGA
jgi:catechol 2,3-dioxygenase-like lactoylglutathione lyase family enzyme